MGITRVGNVTGLDCIGIPTTVAVRPNARSFSVSQGKGESLPQAIASAMMEACELFHAEHIVEQGRLASFAALSSRAPVVPPKLLRRTSAPLTDCQDIAWIEGYDLLQREPCWVPIEVVHTDYTLSNPHYGKHFFSSTNGLASGNHVLEALSSAICEVVERDAVVLWTVRRMEERARCRLDLATVDDDVCRALLQRYERAGILPRVWDITSDIGMAAFVCDIPAVVDVPSGLRRFRGSGCHPDRGVALARALTEAAQIRLTHITGIRDDLPPAHYEEGLAQKIGAALLDSLSQSAPGRRFQDVPSYVCDDLMHDVVWELERLAAAGLERAVAVDLTRSEFDIPVVRLVVPGLEWEWHAPSYKPGRRARRVMDRGG
jgi:ribosomal protein S12 methylthiotransferase accessory factor